MAWEWALVVAAGVFLLIGGAELVKQGKRLEKTAGELGLERLPQSANHFGGLIQGVRLEIELACGRVSDRSGRDERERNANDSELPENLLSATDAPPAIEWRLSTCRQR